MSELGMAPAAQFLERIESYNRLSAQITERIVFDEDNPFVSVAPPEDSAGEESEVDHFNHQAVSLYSEIQAKGSYDNKDLEQAEQVFENFRLAFSTVLPHEPVLEALEDERPMLAVIESGRFEEFLELIRSLPVNFDRIRKSFAYLYLNETGAISTIKRNSEGGSGDQLSPHPKKWKESPSYARTQIYVHTSKAVLGELVALGLLPSDHPFQQVWVESSYDPGIKLMQEEIFKSLGGLELTFTVRPGQRIAVHEGVLKATRFSSILLRDKYDRQFDEFYDEKPTPLDKSMEKFVLRSLELAVTKVSEINQLPTDEAKSLLGIF